MYRNAPGAEGDHKFEKVSVVTSNSAYDNSSEVGNDVLN
jgi:hypothetical protein